MRAMMNVLIVRTSSMGDLIHTYPALTDLAAHIPELSLTWLAEEGFADIAALHPAVDKVVPIAWRRWRRQVFRASTWDEVRACRRALSSTRWDVVLDCQGLVKSAIPARWSGAAVSGYDRASIREPLASLLYARRYRVPRELSAIERNRQLFGQVFGYTPQGAPRFGVGRGQRPSWLGEAPYAVLLHATSRDSKLWPESLWVALGLRLRQEAGLAAVLPWGGPEERARALRLAAAIPGAVAAPRMALREAAGLLGHADAVVGVDTGLTHLANAQDVPLVAIYTDTDPALTGVVETARALNVGGVERCPAVDEVWERLMQCREGAR